MTKEICELDIVDRKRLIHKINQTMEQEFDISQKSIDIFWNYFETGAQMHHNA